MFFRFAQDRHRNYSENAGWSSLVARQAHNLKAAGSNPAPATNFSAGSNPAPATNFFQPRWLIACTLSKTARENITLAYLMMSAAESVERKQDCLFRPAST